ncbi:hypothetical protein ACQ4PT_034737 [Festuca glaucescens]
MDSPDTTVQVSGVGGGRVLLLPFPGMQGHANPMLQLGRRLAYHGLRPTLVLTRYVLSTTAPSDCPFPVAAISDGFDAGGIASCPDTAEYLRRMEAAGSDTLARLLLADDVRVLVYDSHLPWARRVARDAGVAAAAFMTQMCAVDVIYGDARAGRVALPLTDGSALRRRGVLSMDLGPEDVPPFVAEPEWYPAFTDSALGQFDGLEEADDVLVNSFRELEPEHCSMHGMARHPTPCSVVLASYGTVANLDTAQIEELGYGLCNSAQPFLWVLRIGSKACNLHNAGCFLTHCGWNSTTEAIATGVPMMAIPQWADQPTTAKYVESAWGIGLRARQDGNGLVRREEVERCIKEVLGREEYKRNASKWMQKAKRAMKKGGSSDKNITDFVAKYLPNSRSCEDGDS